MWLFRYLNNSRINFYDLLAIIMTDWLIDLGLNFWLAMLFLTGALLASARLSKALEK